MSISDTERERKRLADLYAGYTDEELMALAEDAASLTAVAREALAHEAAARGLALAAKGGEEQNDAQADAAGPEEPVADAVTVKQCVELQEAVFAKATLEANGIRCFLVDDNMVPRDWFVTNAPRGVRVQVPREDAAAARELLAHQVPEDFEVEGVGQYTQPRCPKCGSLDCSLKSYDASPADTGFSEWECAACGHVWSESG